MAIKIRSGFLGSIANFENLASNSVRRAARLGDRAHQVVVGRFAVLGRYWLSHHRFFSALDRFDVLPALGAIPDEATAAAIISQRLVRRADTEGSVPAVEVMINTAFIRECILVPEKTRSIRDAIAAGTSQYGMQTFDQSLYDLFTHGLIAYETALENASNPDDFKLRVQGISGTSESTRDEMSQAGRAEFGR